MRGTPFAASGWTGGLNSVDNPYSIAPDESRDLLNVVSTERGSIKKRFGSTKFSADATTPNLEMHSMAPVVTAGGSFLVVAATTKLYSVNTSGVVTEIGSGFTSGVRWSIIQAPKGTKKTGGPVYLSNGTDKPQFWAGTEKATAVAPWIGESGETWYEDATTKEHVPNGKYSVFAGNRVWMAGMSDDTSAVRFSEPQPVGEGGEQADPTAWPKNNVVRFAGSDGYPITGLGVVGPYVLVFKERKCWAIHNLDTGENRQLSDTVGCVSHRSIVESAIGTFFLTADQGIYSTNGSSLTERSYKVRPTILGINPAQRENAAGAYFNNHYYLSFCTAGESVPNRTLDYDATLNSWWLHDLTGNQWCVWEPTAGETGLFTLPPAAKKGVVKTFVSGVYQDSGVNFTGDGSLGAWWKGHWDPLGYYILRHRIEAPMLKKRLRQVFFNGEGEIIPILYKNFHTGGRQEPAQVHNESMSKPSFPVNFTAGEAKFGEGTEKFGEGEAFFGGEASIGEARIYAAGVFNTVSVGFGNNSKEPFTVDTYVLAISFRKS